MPNADIKSWILLDQKNFWRIWLALLAKGIFLIAISMIFVDQAFAQYFGSPELIKVWLFHRNITEIGAAEVYLVLAILALLIKKYRRPAQYFLWCMLSTGVVLHVIKFFTGRQRPHKTPDHLPFIFEPMNTHHHFQSFPSGHSQTLFTVACFISFYFPKSTPWVMLLALYLSLTRAITLAHFVSDVIAGATLAILVSALTLRYLVKKNGA